MHLGQQIAAARKEMGADWPAKRLLAELHKRGLKKSIGWLQSIEAGRLIPHPEHLAVIADALRKPVDYFKAVADVTPAPGLQFSMVPVLGVVSAQNFAASFDAPPESELQVSLPIAAGKRTGAWRVVGDCMLPTARDGDMIVAVEAQEVPNGRLAIVRLDGECTLKRIFRRDDHVELRPDNPKFKSIILKTNKLHIVGEVLWILKKP